MKNNNTVATVVRIEHDPKTDELYLVFQVTDEDFKRRVKKDWLQDIDLKVIGKNLVEDKDV